MKNVNMTTKGNILTITVDLSKEFGPSSTGKTIIVATTEGNQAVGMTKTGQQIKLGINAYIQPSN